MRVKELENIEQLLDIKDDETFILKIDYSITDNYIRIEDEDGFFLRIEHPYYTVKIFTERLLNDLNQNLNLNFILNEEIKVTEDIANHIKEYIHENKDKHYCGTIGSIQIDK